MSEKKQFQVPTEGSLSLLAYGSKGLRAWRKAREEARQERKNERNEN